MQAVTFMMAILGCGEGDLPCVEIGLSPATYESQAQCLSATEAQLLRQGDALYPVIVAQCRRADGPVQRLSANQVSLPDPEANRAFPIG